MNTLTFYVLTAAVLLAVGTSCSKKEEAAPAAAAKFNGAVLDVQDWGCVDGKKVISLSAEIWFYKLDDEGHPVPCT